MAVFRIEGNSSINLRNSIFKKGVEVVHSGGEGVILDLEGCFFSGACQIKSKGYGQPAYAERILVDKINLFGAKVDKESTLEVGMVDAIKFSLTKMQLLDKCSLYIAELRPQDLYVHDLRITDRANVTFYNVDLSRARFSGTNIEKFNFFGVLWPIDRQTTCIFEEIECREKGIDENDGLIELIEENYRQLVINCEAKRNYAMAERFHFREMELMRVKASKNMWPVMGGARLFFNTYFMYKFLSVYGTNYRRAFLVLCLLFLVFTSAFIFW